MTGWSGLHRSWVVRVLAIAAGVTAIVVPGTSSASPVQDVPTGPAASDQRALSLLRTAYDAGRELHYRGTAFVGVAGSYVRVRIQHLPGKGMLVAPASGDTAADQTQSLLQPDGQPPAGDSDPLAVLAHHYRLVLAGTATVAGRSTVVVEALRSDGSLAATFSIDKHTGLVLARAAYDRTGEQYEQVMFTDIVIYGGRVADAPKFDPGNATVLADPPSGTAELATVGRLRTAGWHVDPALAGGFQLYDARVASTAGAGHRPVLHLSYSDGLCSMSVFEERGRLAGKALAGWRPVSLGGRIVYIDGAAPQRLVWQGGDVVYAVLTDASPTRVASAVAGLPYGDPGNGIVARMARGFDRLGSWLDPFH